MSDIKHIIITGAMKAGTSSLFELIKANFSNVCASSDKELNYFFPETYEGNEPNSYLKNFNIQKHTKYTLEASPSYTVGHRVEVVIPKIINELDDPLLIYIIRDPYDRTISNLKHNIRAGRVSHDLTTHMKERLAILETSDAAYQVREIHKNSRNNLFIKFDDLVKRPKEVLQKIALKTSMSYDADNIVITRKNISNDVIIARNKTSTYLKLRSSLKSLSLKIPALNNKAITGLLRNSLDEIFHGKDAINVNSSHIQNQFTEIASIYEKEFNDMREEIRIISTDIEL